MYKRGFDQLRAEVEAQPDRPDLLRQLVQVADAEEAVMPGVDVPGGDGLGRLAGVPGLQLGATPQEARAQWKRRRYDKAKRAAEAALSPQNPLWLEPVDLRAETCFLWADTLKVLGERQAARDLLTQLAGPNRVIRPPLLPAPTLDQGPCVMAGHSGGPWTQRALAELSPPESLAIELIVNRESAALRYTLILDRRTANQLVHDPDNPDDLYTVPGAALAGARINHSFISSLTPLNTQLSTEGSTVTMVADYRLLHDDLDLWAAQNKRPELGELLELGPMPLELVLPLWARDVPTEVGVRGAGLTLSQSWPLPSEQQTHQMVWRWSPDDPGADRPLRLLTRVEMGTLATLGLMLPGVFPVVPDVAMGLLLLFVISVGLAFHVARRREAPWSEDPVLSQVLDVLVAVILGPVVAIVVLKPLWYGFRGQEPVLALASTLHQYEGQRAYWALGVVCAVILTVVQTGKPVQARYLRRLGLLLFSGYLTVYFGYQPWWQILLVGGLMAPLLYSYWLVPEDSPLLRLSQAEAKAIDEHREELIHSAVVLNDAHAARALLKEWPTRIAKGQGSLEAFEEAREASKALVEAQQARVRGLLEKLGAKELQVRHVVLGVGPSHIPWYNALLALGLGGVPTLMMAFATGKLQATVLVIYLLFFGMTFRWIRGSNGLEKAMSLAVAYNALMILPLLVRVRTQVGLTALLVEALVMTTVLVFAGTMMDLASVGRRWRSLLELYETPDLTRLVGTVGAAATAAAAAALAGSSTDVISLLWGQISTQFGGL